MLFQFGMMAGGLYLTLSSHTWRDGLVGLLLAAFGYLQWRRDKREHEAAALHQDDNESDDDDRYV
jgi:hypothetical protein